VYCEQLVEELDAIGADSFAEGDPQKALFAFQHSLRVKTETLLDFSHLSIANTIHCIADIYSKQRKWSHALGAYESALEVLSYRGNLNDQSTIEAALSLQKKITIIRMHTQIASRNSLPSTVSL
jgi:tetratricopeptide (TPR) repeat protein